jgi:folate-dependent phosphoribosylglycinamide formyltransferase PurN
MKRIVILTGSETRHIFFRKKMALTQGIEVVRSYCETVDQIIPTTEMGAAILRQKHLEARLQSEIDFFGLYTTYVEDKSNAIIIEKGAINSPHYAAEIQRLGIDLIVVYGSSLIKQPLLSLFNRRILNVHLGLSPYYRGASTNFWPLVHGLPECVGATFMYIDEGIDTGEIIHQIRPEVNFFDSPSSMGNRLIKQMAEVYSGIITGFDTLKKPDPVAFNNIRKFCKRSDFTEASVQKLYENFAEGMVDTYLENKEQRDMAFPILKNRGVRVV